jgi:diguanylate cyclase
MTTDAQIKQVQKVCKAALEAMTGRRVPPTPNNYAIWYHNEAATYPDLSSMIRLIEARGDAFGEAVCTQLYQRFFGSNDQVRLIDKTCSRLEYAMSSMLIQFSEAKEGAGAYGQVLEDVRSGLEGPVGVDEVRGLVQQVLDETQKMRERTRELETALAESSREISAISDHLVTAKQQANTDGLTGIANRRYFDEVLEQQIQEANDTGEDLCLLVSDIDHFKSFNDRHGHQIGDQVLKVVARTLTQSIKGRDLAARYGGEEFAIILPMTDLTGATKLGEQIRRSVSQNRIRLKSSNTDLGMITVSIGGTNYVPGETAYSLIERADRALYRAKQEGRNRVIVEKARPTRTAA